MADIVVSADIRWESDLVDSYVLLDIDVILADPGVGYYGRITALRNEIKNLDAKGVERLRNLLVHSDVDFYTGLTRIWTPNYGHKDPKLEIRGVAVLKSANRGP